MITQQEMDDLATMANGCLLPIVNAAATQFPYGDSITTAWDGANPYYDKFTQGIEQYEWSNCDTVSPQPPYSFTLNPYLNIVPAGAAYGADVGGGIGNFSVVVSDDGSYDFIPATTGTTGDSLTDGSFSYIWPTKCFYLKAGTYVMSGAAGQPVKAVLTKTQCGWMQELNRMRGDAMALTGLFGLLNPPDNPLKLNPAAVCSGPWCVGVNDPVTWPPLFHSGGYFGTIGNQPEFSNQGELQGDFGTFIVFNSVRYYFASADAGSLSVYSGRRYDSDFVTGISSTSGTTGLQTLDLNYTSAMSGTWEVAVAWAFSGAVGAAPAVSSFTTTSTGGVATWSTRIVSPGNFILLATFSIAVPAGSGTVSLTADTLAGYPFNTFDFTAPFQPLPHNLSTFAAVVSRFIASTESALVSTPVIHPESTGEYISASDITPTSAFSLPNPGLGGIIASELGVHASMWKISDPTVKGVWVAKTLPVPGENVFLDQDMPPYVGEVIPVGYNVTAVVAISAAVAGNGQSTGAAGNPLATTMRQTAPISFDLSNNPVYLNGKIQSVSPGITARPAKWLVRRDTDFVPFELGFNSGLSHTVYSGQVAPASGDLVSYNVLVPSNATKVLIRLVQPGTVPGWKAGVFQYGDALSENLTIIVKQSDYPTATVYDFKTTNNAVTIDPDGGGSYLATVLNGGFDFAVMATNGNDVAYDCYVEIDTATPQRVYFPPVGECFSYVINGTPGVFPDYTAYLWGNLGPKPIPQNGYCIFKVRATRIPTDNGYGIAVTPSSGAALTVTVGQNVLSGGVLTFMPFKLDDGVTNLTVTIPADGRDSGDVKVFIPVLAGNELVYQCSAQVIFEAWANWQPVFFSNIYGNGQYPIDPTYTVNQPLPTVFQYALNFANDFNITRMGWPQKYAQSGATGSEVQFPLFRELYDDLVALLTLLGGVLPSGSQAGGAGGTGSAGDGGSAGNDGGGGQL